MKILRNDYKVGAEIAENCRNYSKIGVNPKKISEISQKLALKIFEITLKWGLSFNIFRNNTKMGFSYEIF